MNKYAIIMAGGYGKRLFPISTPNRPKQFLNLYGNEIMINETINRVSRVIPVENIFIVINQNQKELAERYIDRRIKKCHILFEPKMCNTAICVCYAVSYITEIYGEGIIGVFSTDHYIDDLKKFDIVLNEAISYVKENDNIVVIGIKPTFPSTQFGYIKYRESNSAIKSVDEFIEKPNFDKAKEYINNNYVWNSGIFIWNTETIKKAFLNFLPDLYKKFQKIKKYFSTDLLEQKLEVLYNELEPISIDYGIIEKATNISMILANFGWMDIGNLESLLELYENKIIKGKNINNCKCLDSHNIFTFSTDDNKRYIVSGLNDLVIVENEEICLIANKKNLEHNLKEITTEYKNICKNS